MKAVSVLTVFQADLDGARGDGGHVAHSGALVVVDGAPPPAVGAAAAVLQVDVVTLLAW